MQLQRQSSCLYFQNKKYVSDKSFHTTFLYTVFVQCMNQGTAWHSPLTDLSKTNISISFSCAMKVSCVSMQTPIIACHKHSHLSGSIILLRRKCKYYYIYYTETESEMFARTAAKRA